MNFKKDDHKRELEKERCNTFGVKHPSPGRTQGALATLPTLGFDMKRPWRKDNAGPQGISPIH